jgi:hypothetical protein
MDKAGIHKYILIRLQGYPKTIASILLIEDDRKKGYFTVNDGIGAAEGLGKQVHHGQKTYQKDNKTD